MGKGDQAIKKYSYFRVLLVAIVCGVAALGVNYLILQEHINHTYEASFAPVVVSVLLCIFNFKPLSKLSIILLPPAFVLLVISPVFGVAAASKFGVNADTFGGNVSLLIQSVPFVLVASLVFKWYAGLAKQQSGIVYSLFMIVTVIVSFLLFKDGFSYELVMAGYLGVASLCFSKLHVGTILG
jgi:hypothetical protein